ncbi:MAG: ABC transporter substrate-binding protein [Deltaproteobacteria bacterium]|nr:ABC transporter substrate-binding protein [Deltaproteobacteria bacterium]
MTRLVSLAPLFVVLVGFTVSAFAQELTRIRYGTTASAAHLPILVGWEGGIFKKNGLEVEPIHIRGGALITAAILSGSLQFSGAGAESVVAARVEGADVVLLACPANSDAVYLIVRPEIKSAADLKGKASAVTRLGSTTHFYLRTALRHVGLDPDKDMTIMQLGAGPEISAALENGRVVAAALTIRYALPFFQKGWPVMVDLGKTDMVYPSSCVASSRSTVREQPALVERFLKAYVQAIRTTKKDRHLAERAFAKWSRENDSAVVAKTVEAYARLFKPIPYVPDKGIEAVLTDLSKRRPVPKELFGRPEYFRDNGPLEKAVKTLEE